MKESSATPTVSFDYALLGDGDVIETQEAFKAACDVGISSMVLDIWAESSPDLGNGFLASFTSINVVSYSNTKTNKKPQSLQGIHSRCPKHEVWQGDRSSSE